MGESYPVWWQGVASPPPAEWVYVFEDFTSDDTAEQWALAAAIFVAQIRRRTAAGPTYAELFTYLLPDSGGLPGPLPRGLEFIERRRVIAGFRGHAVIEWRRQGMISYDAGVMRSLRVGREFRERSRRRQQARGIGRRMSVSAGIDVYEGGGGMLGYSATVYEMRQGVGEAEFARIGEVPYRDVATYFLTLTAGVIAEVPYRTWVDHLLNASEGGRARLLHGGRYPFLFHARGFEIKRDFAASGIEAIATLEDKRWYLVEAWDQS